MHLPLDELALARDQGINTSNFSEKSLDGFLALRSLFLGMISCHCLSRDLLFAQTSAETVTAFVIGELYSFLALL